MKACGECGKEFVPKSKLHKFCSRRCKERNRTSKFCLAAKAEQLGMSPSTAYNRLRKRVLFDCVKRLGENVCFQCGEIIKDHSDMSIEHKKPWLHECPSLFWDMENIAFSHKGCNSSAARRPTRHIRKITKGNG